jgi:hypothetical protein
MLYCGGNFERSRALLHSSGMMPRMLSRSRLSRRLSRLSELVQLVFLQLGLTLKELTLESGYSLDSFSLPVCDNIRISRCRLARGTEFHGYLASEHRYFYGVWVQVLVTVEGLRVEFCVLPGSLSDLAGLAELPLQLPAGAQVAADAAYSYSPIKLIRQSFNNRQLGLSNKSGHEVAFPVLHTRKKKSGVLNRNVFLSAFCPTVSIVCAFHSFASLTAQSIY